MSCAKCNQFDAELKAIRLNLDLLTEKMNLAKPFEKGVLQEQMMALRGAGRKILEEKGIHLAQVDHSSLP